MGRVAIHGDATTRLERDESRKGNCHWHWRRITRRIAVGGGVVGIATVLALGSGAAASASHGRASRDAGLTITSEPFSMVPVHPPAQ